MVKRHKLQDSGTI